MIIAPLRHDARKARARVDVDRGGRSGRHRNAALRREFARAQFVAEQFERGGVGTDERDAGVGQRRGEARVLREKSVTGMHRIAVVGARGSDHRGDVEIRRNAAPRECVRRIGARDVQRTRVVGCIDGGRGDVEFVGGANDADGDFAAVGDENAAYGSATAHVLDP